ARVGFDSVRSITGLPARRRSMRARVRRLGVRLAGTRGENIVVVGRWSLVVGSLVVRLAVVSQSSWSRPPTHDQELTTIDYFDPLDDVSFEDRVPAIPAPQ